MADAPKKIETVTIKINPSSTSNPQASRVVVDQNGNRLVSFMQGDSADEVALYYPKNATNHTCATSVDKFNVLWGKLRDEAKTPLQWRDVDNSKQATVTAAPINLSALCKSPQR